MRQVVLDTETTGLEVASGHRIVEIGAVELVERRRTGKTFHRYLNPDRAIDAAAREITGISDEFLLDKPHFADIAAEFVTFIEGAELVIHNAAFDVGFLDAELARAGDGYGSVSAHAGVLDTLELARRRYPGQRNNLDALCKRLGVDNRHRELHGGLLDAQLLADVYLAMTMGQSALTLDFAANNEQRDETLTAPRTAAARPAVIRANAEELGAHAARLDALDHACEQGSLWRRVMSDQPAHEVPGSARHSG